MRTFCSACLLFVLCFHALAQEGKQIDSLKHALRNSPSDSVSDLAYASLINSYYGAARYDSVLNVGSRYIHFLSAYHNKYPIGYIQNLIGNIFCMRGNYTEAMAYYFSSLKSHEKLDNKEGIGQAYGNLGMIYGIKHEMNKSLDYYKKASQLLETTKDTINLANMLNNIGNIYFNNDNTKALAYFTRSLRLREAVNDRKGVSASLLQLSDIYEQWGKTDSSQQLRFKALAISEAADDKFGIASLGLAIGETFLKQRNYKGAESYLNKAAAMSVVNEDLGTTKQVNECRSRLYEALGKYELALKYYKAFIAARDSLTNEENTKKAVRLEMDYEFDKKQAAAKLEQEKKEAMALTEKRRQEIVIWSVCGILVLALAFAVFAYRSYIEKQKINIEITKQKHVIEEKQKEIVDSIVYARRIQRALITSESYIARQLDRLSGTSKSS
ncbi:MAG: tetratricopeptide repeat protein [Bacteroidia bacterium]